MKKIISLSVVCIFIFLLTACGSNNNLQNQNNEAVKSSVTTTESTTEKTTAYRDVINSYLKNINFLEKKTYDMYSVKNYMSENPTMTTDKSSEGYLDYRVYDFDNDKQDELLLISHKFTKPSCMDLSQKNKYEIGHISYLCIEMFEVEAGSLVKKDEAILFNVRDEIDGYAEMIIFNYQGSVQIGFGISREGFWGTGRISGFCSLKYNGSRFEKIMMEYWCGSGDPDMFQNIFDKLDEIYGITKDKILGDNLQYMAFDSNDWMSKNFDIIGDPLNVSITAYNGNLKLEHYEEQKEVTFKISWK